ncbi:MAG: TonB-dependent receptor, partial [Cyclobacteriaceae bacterium]
EDIIIYSNRYINSDRQDVAGIEAETSVKLSDRISLTASYTLLNGKTVMNISDSTFTGLLRQPNHTFRIAVNYRPSVRWAFTVSSRLFGERNDVYFDNDLFVSRSVVLDSYSLVDLRAGYQVAEKVWLQAEINNLFDSDYYEVYGYSVLGVNIHAGLRWSM